MGFQLGNTLSMHINPLSSLQSLREQRQSRQNNAVENPGFEASLQEFRKSVHEFCDLWQSRINTVFVESPLLETVIQAADEKLARRHLEALQPFLRMEHFDEGSFPERPSILTDRIGKFQVEVPTFLSKKDALGRYLRGVAGDEVSTVGWQLDAISAPEERAALARAKVGEWHQLAIETLSGFRQSMDRQIEKAFEMKEWWETREIQGLDSQQRKSVFDLTRSPLIAEEFGLAHAISRNLIEEPAPRSGSPSWRP